MFQHKLPRTAALLMLGFTALGALAQTAASAPSPAATPGIDQRQAHQEKRIDQGVASGQLTRREAHRLDRQQNLIDRAENRAKADGVVTKQERQRLHAAQDTASQRIARQKHDRQQRPGTN
jgi:hypothetical protein